MIARPTLLGYVSGSHRSILKATEKEEEEEE